MSDEPKAKLTPEQIDNWRKALCFMIGPYALLMSADEIQHYRDRMQDQHDARNIDSKPEAA